MAPIPDWVAAASKVIFDHANKECDEKRKFMIPIWKRAEYYWNDIQDLFYNADKSDWSTFDEDNDEDEMDAIKDSNKIINTYRAEGESIIAAATMGNLSLRFFPENADNPIDLDKAKSFSDKSDYVQRVNNIKELRRKAFTIRWNQGLVASYTYFKKDKKRFGTISKDVIGVKKQTYIDKKCEQCGETIQGEAIDNPEDLANKMMGQMQPPLQNELPIDPNAEEQTEPIDNLLEESQEETCPECGSPLTSQEPRTEDIPYKIGEEKKDRGCSTIELYSPLQFKIPHYATKVSDINYILLEGEIHYATARSLYPDYADQIQPNDIDSVESPHRTQADNYSSVASNSLVTISRFWCKPDMYNVLGEEKDYNAAKMLKQYPDGKFATFINGNLMVDCKNEDMDEHWTFVESALDSHVYIRALGNARIPIQDMENDLVFITMDTIRHAIGETFYDSRVIDRRAYRERMTKPGDMTPVNVSMLSGRSIQDCFYSTKNANLSREVDSFQGYLERKGQFISGALPSLFGGMFEQGSKTLGVYESSKNQALQRVSIPANGIDDFLATTVHKATELYDRNMEGDEVYSVEAGNSYNNVTLRKSAPGAKIATVKAVKSEQFPTTWEQKRAFVMEMLDKQLDPINAAIFGVDNLGSLDSLIGIPELKIPGVADRNKQLHEINDLLKAEPQPDPNIGPPVQDPMADPSLPLPQAPLIPTIMPDQDVDNHNIHIQTIISWAVSPEGMREKVNNPGGYTNVIMHLIQHKNLAAAMMATPEQEAEVAKNEGEK